MGLERHHGILTNRLTQVLTGHGTLSRFLFLIGREETPGCHHCEDRPEDTVEHTVAVSSGIWSVTIDASCYTLRCHMARTLRLLFELWSSEVVML
uniref:SFRICE_031655 n=1 Tax=Spodoptera frugiperda TaxID=7108 RepID=A0A2H1W6G5_SPOFR